MVVEPPSPRIGTLAQHCHELRCTSVAFASSLHCHYSARQSYQAKVSSHHRWRDGYRLTRLSESFAFHVER